MRKPNFFIVGHTRSATSSLLDQLKQHPDVFIIHTGTGYTPAFFGYSPLIKTEEKYLELFSNAKNEKCVGEKNTDNVMCEESAPKIKKHYPDAKIIICLRNPIDVMYSKHSQQIMLTMESLTDFKEAIKIGPERERINKEKPGTYDENLLYRKTVRYPEQIKRYFDLFGKEKIHIRILDDVIKDELLAFKKTCEFLEVNPDFKPKIVHKNAIRHYRMRSLQALVKKMEGTKTRKILSKIPGIQKSYNFANLPHVKRVPLDVNFKNKLYKEFEPEIKELSKILDRDLSFWLNN
jgi:hypothetical protein